MGIAAFTELEDTVGVSVTVLLQCTVVVITFLVNNTEVSGTILCNTCCVTVTVLEDSAARLDAFGN